MARPRLPLNEGEEIGVDLLLMCGREPVRRSGGEAHDAARKAHGKRHPLYWPYKFAEPPLDFVARVDGFRGVLEGP